MSRVRSSIAFSLNSKISFKIIVVGDRGVGKTSLIVRYVKGTFDKNYNVTVGVQFYSRILEVRADEIALQIWDTAGQQNFRSIVRSFYHMASCVVIAYSGPEDMAKRIQGCILQINEHASPAARKMLVRTKTDQNPFSQEQRREVEALQQKHGIDLFMQVSSKQNTNIQQFFKAIGQRLYGLYKKSDDFREIVDPKQNSFALQEIPQIQSSISQKKKCC